MRRTFTAVAMVTLVATGCTFNSGGGAPNAATYQEQIDAYNRQMEQSETIQKQQADELERIQKMLSAQELLTERQENLMTKWEEQARRMDAVLDAQEKQAGIKGKDTTP